MWAHARCAVTALYSRRHDTTVPARTEPRQTAGGSPPFGSRSLARAAVRSRGRSCGDREPPPPAPPPLRRGGVTRRPPLARSPRNHCEGRTAVRAGGLRFLLPRLQSPGARMHDTSVPARTEPRDTACGSPPFGSRSLARAGVCSPRLRRSPRLRVRSSSLRIAPDPPPHSPDKRKRASPASGTGPGVRERREGFLKPCRNMFGCRPHGVPPSPVGAWRRPRELAPASKLLAQKCSFPPLPDRDEDIENARNKQGFPVSRRSGSPRKRRDNDNPLPIRTRFAIFAGRLPRSA
jgi:hypothetical protein